MSLAPSLTTTHIPRFKCQDISKNEHNIFPTRENPSQKTPLDTPVSRRNLLKTCGSGLLAAGLSSIQPARAEPESPQQAASSRMSYSRFLEYLNEGAGLPKELLRKLEEKGVDFAAHPIEPNYVVGALDFLANFTFPLLFLGSLLLRSSSPGGPNLPFGLGRSKAKFQMEPNTGIMFDDVAGVDEAKQDFKEIVEFLKSPGQG